MKFNRILFLLPLLWLAGPPSATAEGMAVFTWDPGCNHTMTTNHFELKPGEKVRVELDLTGCDEKSLGGLLFFGYRTTKNSSRQLTRRDKVRLTMVDSFTGARSETEQGYLLSEVFNPTRCELYAENTDPRKAIIIRLRASSGL